MIARSTMRNELPYVLVIPSYFRDAQGEIEELTRCVVVEFVARLSGL